MLAVRVGLPAFGTGDLVRHARPGRGAGGESAAAFAAQRQVGVDAPALQFGKGPLRGVAAVGQHLARRGAQVFLNLVQHLLQPAVVGRIGADVDGHDQAR